MLRHFLLIGCFLPLDYYSIRHCKRTPHPRVPQSLQTPMKSLCFKFLSIIYCHNLLKLLLSGAGHSQRGHNSCSLVPVSNRHDILGYLFSITIRWFIVILYLSGLHCKQNKFTRMVHFFFISFYCLSVSSPAIYIIFIKNSLILVFQCFFRWPNDGICMNVVIIVHTINAGSAVFFILSSSSHVSAVGSYLAQVLYGLLARFSSTVLLFLLVPSALLLHNSGLHHSRSSRTLLHNSWSCPFCYRFKVLISGVVLRIRPLAGLSAAALILLHSGMLMSLTLRQVDSNGCQIFL